VSVPAPHPRAVTPGGAGRFPGFDVLDHAHLWDSVTAGVVLARLEPASELRFFTPAEQPVAEALLDRLLAQDREPKVPVLQLVDRRLALGQTDGWRYDDLPEDPVAWRLTLAALDQDAIGQYGRRFPSLDRPRQESMVQAVQDAQSWHGWPTARVWSLWTRYACTAFYSHPWAWNEIGFGGPAYPRGYAALGVGKREHWEVPDRGERDPLRPDAKSGRTRPDRGGDPRGSER
jgi:hypothetical protein